MKRMTKKMTIDELAVMVKIGFDDLHETMSTGFTNAYKTIDGVKDEMHSGFEKVDQRLNALEEGQRSQYKETEVCRHHRALTDARLSRLESVIS